MSVSKQRLEAAVDRMDALSNWEQRPRKRMRPSLDPIRDLLARIGDPHLESTDPEHPLPPPRVVHVAGSKGKGSLAALVAAGLERAGLTVGVYASPHVESMTERVRIGGREVEPDALADALDLVLDARAAATEEGSDARDATWFDTITAAGLWLFARHRVDWIVAECGLGGRLDSTNVLDGEVAAVTSIELEHTDVLGDTRAKIAAEKVGILKAGATLVTPLPEADEAGAVLAERARELGCTVLRPEGATGGGGFEASNRALGGLILGELGRRGHLRAASGDPGGRPVEGGPLGPDLLDEVALDAARLPGRMERFSRSNRSGVIPVVLDGAHTPDSVDGCLAAVEADPSLPGRPVVVLGLALEKDLPGILKTLVGRVDSVVCTSVGGALHRTPEQIESEAREAEMVAETASPPRVALDRALQLATERGGWVLAIGSLYLAGELRPHLR